MGVPPTDSVGVDSLALEPLRETANWPVELSTEAMMRSLEQGIRHLSAAKQEKVLCAPYDGIIGDDLHSGSEVRGHPLAERHLPA